MCSAALDTIRGARNKPDVTSPMTAKPPTDKPPLRILLCSPRGFCAGVVRAIDVVEKALDRFGAPVYVRHEIVHNRYVVDSLKAKGAIFVEELSEVPDTTSPVIFSAHGVAKSVPAEAQARNLLAIDATCPLVTKVHREAEIHHRRGRDVILVGHAGHPEVVGTIGQLPVGSVVLVEIRRRCRAPAAARRRHSCFRHPDDAVDRRYQGNRRRADARNSPAFPARIRKISATRPQTARRR